LRIVLKIGQISCGKLLPLLPWEIDLKKRLFATAAALLLAATIAPAPAIHAVTPINPVPTDQTKMKLVKTITGGITPKSVRASQTGLVAAFNMMYRHTITIYDVNKMKLVKTVYDKVKLSKFGFTQYTGELRGAPVEGAFSPDGRYLYATNYSMYGGGFGPEGSDLCNSDAGLDDSFLYRINLDNYKIDNVYEVGAVPKVVEVTPDNKYVLVTNWCGFSLDVIDVAKDKVIKTIPIGRHPRGIIISPDSKFAYVAEMGGVYIRRVNLSTWKIHKFYVGSGPRALVLSPDGKYLYLTLNTSGSVLKFDLQTHKKVKETKTGSQARSLAISDDGSSLYVVHWGSGTLVKLRSSDMKVLQRVNVCDAPIGVTFDGLTDRTWVGCYRGQIKVYDNR
jgi:YVTN family beta-propeller protein